MTIVRRSSAASAELDHLVVAATTLGSTNALAINRRVSSATLGYGNFALVEIRATTAALTDAQITELHLYRVDGQRPGRVEITIAEAS